MIKAKLTSEEKEILFLAIIAQFFIGLILLLNMEYFPIDNPSVLLIGKGDLLDYVFVENIRLNFMYSIICWVSSKILGDVPQAFFIVQWLFFEFIYVLIYRLCSYYTKSVKTKVFVIFCGMAATSVAEQLFTIGKQEIFLTFGIVAVILLTYMYFYVEMPRNPIRIKLFLLGVSTLFSFTLKETSNILLAWFLFIVVYNWFWQPQYRKKIKFYVITIAFSLFLVAIYKKIYVVNSTYTDINWTINIFFTNVISYIVYNFDILVIGLIGIVHGLIGWIRDRENYNKQFLFIINICGWGYFFGISLWRWSFAYYIYPCAVLFTISLIGFLVYTKPRLKKIIVYVLLLLSVYGLQYNYKVAVSHIDVGASFTNSINKIDQIIKNNPGRILVEDYNFWEEHPY